MLRSKTTPSAFSVLWPMLAPALAIAPPDPRYAELGLQTPDTAIWAQTLSRLSPNHLFGEAMLAPPSCCSLPAISCSSVRR